MPEQPLRHPMVNILPIFEALVLLAGQGHNDQCLKDRQEMHHRKPKQR